ncbi:MAG: family 16 glycoside hydrolase, partial [Planctomycetota bacterium]
GYQADISPEYDGYLYDESRRRKFLAQCDKATQERAQKAIAADGWNHYHIRAVGDRIQIWLNDVQTVDYTEPEKAVERDGIIAIQIHGGMRGTIAYKDITIRDLTPNHMEVPMSDDGLAGEGPLRRYDWFRNLWKSKRAAWAKDVDKDQNAIVFLGDSITQGWGGNMGGAFGDAKVANRGISGDTTRGMLLRLREDVIDLNPTAVVMLMGTNDLEEAATPEQVAANVASIIAALKKHNPTMPIIWCHMFPSSETKKRPANKIKRVNKLVAAQVKGDKQVIVLETWQQFANSAGDATKQYFPDLLHPNKAGYAKWAAALRPIFATLGYVETDKFDFTPDEGFTSLFNGKNLDGWGTRRKKTRKPLESFDGKQVSPDGRYAAINGKLVVTTPPEGRRFQQLWTTRDFEGDFTLKLEFRATPFADSGIFLKGKQLQCRDYLIAGPYTELKKYKPQDWNQVDVVCKDNVAHCTCNGEVLEATFEIPAKGPMGLEGDRGQMEYRRIQFRQD